MATDPKPGILAQLLRALNRPHTLASLVVPELASKLLSTDLKTAVDGDRPMRERINVLAGGPYNEPCTNLIARRVVVDRIDTLAREVTGQYQHSKNGSDSTLQTSTSAVCIKGLAGATGSRSRSVSDYGRGHASAATGRSVHQSPSNQQQRQKRQLQHVGISSAVIKLTPHIDFIFKGIKRLDKSSLLCAGIVPAKQLEFTWAWVEEESGWKFLDVRLSFPDDDDEACWWQPWLPTVSEAEEWFEHRFEHKAISITKRDKDRGIISNASRDSADSGTLRSGAQSRGPLSLSCVDKTLQIRHAVAEGFQQHQGTSVMSWSSQEGSSDSSITTISSNEEPEIGTPLVGRPIGVLESASDTADEDGNYWDQYEGPDGDTPAAALRAENTVVRPSVVPDSHQYDSEGETDLFAEYADKHKLHFDKPQSTVFEHKIVTSGEYRDKLKLALEHLYLESRKEGISPEDFADITRDVILDNTC